MRPDHRRLGSTAGPGAQGAAAVSQTAILIHHRDPARNVARFYAMPVRADLLAGWTLVREWSRAENSGTCGINRHLTKSVPLIVAIHTLREPPPDVSQTVVFATGLTRGTCQGRRMKWLRWIRPLQGRGLAH